VLLIAFLCACDSYSRPLVPSAARGFGLDVLSGPAPFPLRQDTGTFRYESAHLPGLMNSTEWTFLCNLTFRSGFFASLSKGGALPLPPDQGSAFQHRHSVIRSRPTVWSLTEDFQPRGTRAGGKAGSFPIFSQFCAALIIDEQHS
jgi:hypothetical protein